MREKDYSNDLGGTAGCTLRLARGPKYGGDTDDRKRAEERKKPEIIYGDSWFGSMVSIEIYNSHN